MRLSNYPPGVTGNESYLTGSPDIVILNQRWVLRARKDHKCSTCGAPIKKGSPYNLVVGLDYDNGGKFFCEKMHPVFCPWEAEMAAHEAWASQNEGSE